MKSFYQKIEDEVFFFNNNHEQNATMPWQVRCKTPQHDFFDDDSSRLLSGELGLTSFQWRSKIFMFLWRGLNVAALN